MPKTMKILLLIILVELVVIVCVACQKANASSDDQEKEFDIMSLEADDETIMANLVSGTPAPEPLSLSKDDALLMDSDLYWLARIMQSEDGVDWSENDILKIGEVACNRLASPLFPDSIREIALQGANDPDIPTQYAPFEQYEEWVPDDYYIYLAERLLDGERVLNDPDVIYQSLFVQGEVADAVYDAALGTTTYFCKG